MSTIRKSAVAIAPLFVIWMGTGAEPKLAIAVLIAVFLIVIDTVLGLKSVPPDILDLRGHEGRHLACAGRGRTPCDSLAFVPERLRADGLSRGFFAAQPPKETP